MAWLAALNSYKATISTQYRIFVYCPYTVVSSLAYKTDCTPVKLRQVCCPYRGILARLREVSALIDIG